jgi:hypothetical protein
MNLEDFRKQKRAKVVDEFELDKDAFEKLIEEKFKRARAYHQALSKREEQLIEQD